MQTQVFDKLANYGILPSVTFFFETLFCIINMIIRIICFISFVLYWSHMCFANDIATKNVGEQSMIKSLRQAIDSTPEINSSKYKIIIGAGVSGAEAFNNQPHESEINILLTWQWLDKLKELAENTIVVVPEHAIDKRFESLKNRGVKLIAISGVLHTKTKDKVQSESVEKINPSTRYIVMLAGDAQQEDGKWASYNKKMLMDFLKYLPKDQNILILNGPRTGKHLENTDTQHALAHKTETDYITAAVQDMAVAKWQIVDFKYDEKSLWDNALNFCLIHPEVGLILPGESTSMISEALSLGIRPIIYTHQAMTPASYRYVKQLQKGGSIFEYPKGLRAENYTQEPAEDQIKKIVNALVLVVKESK